MLETVDLDAEISKKEYKELAEKLDIELAACQRQLREARIPVLIVFEGWDAAGKGSSISRLVQPLDPRGFKVHNVRPANETEHLYPPMWRFWNLTPARGQIAVFNHSWYRQVWNEPIEEYGSLSLGDAYERIRVFERQLADDGAVIVKFFLHISKKTQKKRFEALLSDPAFSWKIGPMERKRHRMYDRYLTLAEDMFRETSTAYAPWTLVPATNERFRNIRIAETLVAAFQSALARSKPPEAQPASVPSRFSPLDRVDLSLKADPEVYEKRMKKLQLEVRRLQHLCYRRRKAVVIAFEGWDAAGKGGAIRRLTRELDPRGYEVIPIGAPEGVEKAHHHLWRFWRALPKGGHWTIFDRTWYGRVLVERIEGFARTEEWLRAYREINEFESELVEHGTIVLKFWLHISKEEQLARFESRQNTPEKQWKITEEDWRNREKWDAYYQAVTEMIEQTSTAHAPWIIVEGNDKRYARLKVLESVTRAVRNALGKGQEIEFDDND
ncbi:MAG TPA: polyphosphate:AMP phosphotransferase [Candidatus Hydrogenedentes bacterium]|nr:polyphosphate:AMP phosphotransferase [Candidatus Hydrogenedentota bacterium]